MGVDELNEQKIKDDLNHVIKEWIESGHLKKGDTLVIGCSTSEVIGERIGTSGNADVAKILYEGLVDLQVTLGIHLAFQCCEHLNRALVVEREVMKEQQLTEVSVVPVPKAGGSMASHAYKQMNDPVVVEFIQADAGMDIGETLIGMHVKHVTVPLRFKQRYIGNARVTAAYSRPKLIGGARANYENTRLNGQCD